ncbi:hypothetical protein [Candidatus Nanohalobium constans]|uniref:Uncharacterized protein n=1 Tax=Candidatus Nanohalobium constans TaxID=2565781 RepID=A0A5Q0UGR4_9ARCH|nr:hypothetical protein [Candidatus Nanohalobium constans]QGA80145.1 hypothetical protein LC1Nh_0241 [Candidatus Nanohalobium constans]
MSLLEPSFQLTQDSSPLGDTSIIEAYRMPEEENGIALYREIESLAAMRERLEEDQLVTDEDVEPDKADVRFEIGNDELDVYRDELAAMLEGGSKKFEQYRGTAYSVMLYDGCGREYRMGKWDDVAAPEKLKWLWGELRRTAFKNTI